MYYFAYWLEHFKELTASKSQGIVKNLIQISVRTEADCVGVCKLVDCSSLSTFNRVKQIIFKKYSGGLSQTEKKALTLFGDYWEVREYSNYKFPEEENINLIKYCETMSMSYSYKAVLLLTLANCMEVTQTITLDELCAEMTKFYRNRIDSNLPAEKSNSIFANKSPKSTEAKKIIVNNPVKALVEAGVIVWDKKSDSISFAMDYPLGNDMNRLRVIDICTIRINDYFAAQHLDVPAVNEAGSDDISWIMRLKKLRESILNVSEERERDTLWVAHKSLCEGLWAEKTLLKLTYIDLSDERKIGALAQACFAELEATQYPFTQEQIDDLSSLTWSSKSFKKLYYPVLKPYDPSLSIDEQRVDYKGNGRYYDQLFILAGQKFLVTSQWYKDAREQFIVWYNGLN